MEADGVGMAMMLSVSGTELDYHEGIDELIRLALAGRASAVELWYPKNFAKDGISRTLDKLRCQGIGVSCISTPSTLYGQERQRGRELLARALDLAEQIGAPVVNTYFGHSGRVDDARAIQDYAREITPIVREAGMRGITVVLENEFNAFGWDPAGSDITRRPCSLARLFEVVNDDSFKLNFDAANFYCASVDPYQDAYSVLGGRVGYVHVKDVVEAVAECDPDEGWRRFTDLGTAFDTTRLGNGSVPWRQLLIQLAADGYDGYLALEPHCRRERLLREVVHAAEFINFCLPSMGVNEAGLLCQDRAGTLSVPKSSTRYQKSSCPGRSAGTGSTPRWITHRRFIPSNGSSSHYSVRVTA